MKKQQFGKLSFLLVLLLCANISTMASEFDLKLSSAWTGFGNESADPFMGIDATSPSVSILSASNVTKIARH